MRSWRERESAQGQKSSWKKKPHAAGPAEAGGKYWATGAGSKPLLSSNVIRLFLALAALLATTVGMVVYLLNTNVSTPLVSIVAVDYEHPWAPNAWAVEDQQHLQALQESSQFRVSAKAERGAETWDQLIRLELDKVTPGGPGGSLIPALWGYRTLIIHLSAHAALNSRGEPCLLFTQAQSLDEQTWVPLANVLSAIGDHPRVTQHAARVLVILDTGKQPPDIRSGLITAAFVAAARERIQGLPYSSMAVLLACDEQQTAWTAPEMGGSVFGVMVASGLQGWADSLAGNRDNRVSVQELARFVAATVDGYVHEHRGRSQQPQLVWCGEDQTQDFELCYESNYATSAASSYQPNARIDQLTRGWQALQRWHAELPSHAAWPRAIVVARLARAEQLLWAGGGYAAQFDAELNAAQQLMQVAQLAAWPASICGASQSFLNRVHRINGQQALQQADLDLAAVDRLPLAASAQPRSAAEAASAGAAASPGSGPSAGADPAAADPAAATQPAAERPTPSPADEPPLTSGQRIVQWLTFDPQQAGDQPPPPRPDLPPRPLAVGFVVGWLAGHPQAVNVTVLDRVLEWWGPIVDSRSVTREEALVRTMADHLRLIAPWKLATQHRISQLWSQYLAISQECELAVALIEPRGTAALEPQSQRLTAQMQLVRDQISGCETDSDASRCAEELISLRKAAEEVLAVRRRVERAWRLRDELALELPALCEWLASPISRLQSRLSAEAGWQAAGELAGQLQALHGQLTASQIPENSRLDELESHLEQLAAAYREALHVVIESSAKGQRRQVSDLLLCLGLRPNLYRGHPLHERSEMHVGLNKRFADLANVYGPEQLASYYQIGSSRVSAPEQTAALASAIWQLSDLPAEITRDYWPLRLAEVLTGQPLESARRTALPASQRWAAVGGELRLLWRTLPARLIESAQNSQAAMETPQPAALAAAEEQLRQAEYGAHLLAGVLPADQLRLPADPCQLLLALGNEQFALWQARRSLHDFWKTPLLPHVDQGLFFLGSAADWQAAVPTPARGLAKLAEQARAATVELAGKWPEVWRNVQPPTAAEPTWQAELDLADFPAGSAWLSLAQDGDPRRTRQLQDKRYQSEYRTGGLGSSTARMLLPQDMPEGTHLVRAWFRGHVATEELVIAAHQPPLTLAWQPEPPAETTIRVEAEPKPARIVFVLDCSNSLTAARMKLAKDTLLELIRDIAVTAPSTEIAVILFGHRVEYQNSQTDRYSAWVKQPLSQIHPYNDVELVQPLVVPAPQALAALEATLDGLQKFGRTPLYESIKQAAQVLRSSQGSFTGEMRIVVITDGDDNVYPADPARNAVATGRLKVPAEFIHTEEDVRRIMGEDLRLDFVTFNFPSAGEQDRLEGLVASLNRSRRRAGLLRAGDRDLAEQLRKSISGTYSTKDLASNITIGTRVRVAEEQRIPAERLTQPLNRFEVQIDDTTHRTTVALAGGETIELQYLREAGLRFLPYDEGDQHPLRGDVSLAGQAYQAIMLTGRPRSVPQLRLCWQAVDARLQSLRPDVFLLELQRTQPGQSSAQGQRLAWTADGMWENHHRSPEMRVMLRDLPELHRDRLECRLWVADPARLPVNTALPIARLKEQPVDIATGVSVTATTERQGSGLRLQLIEKRAEQAPLVHWQVFPAADRGTAHRISAGLVVHEFLYSDPLVLGRLEATAIVLPEAADETWQTTEWITVPSWQ